MLDDETFRRIFEAHGATITGVPGVYIDGEKKTIAELHRLIDEHYFEAGGETRRGDGQRAERENSDTAPCANDFDSSEEYAQAMITFSDGRTPKEPKLLHGGDGGCIESAEGMGAVADKLAEGVDGILEGFSL